MQQKFPLLIVEGDPTQQTLFARSLSAHPYAISMASNAAEAMDAFEKIGHGAVLCDMALPGEKSGIDILRWLMARANAPVVVMLTADGDIAKVIETMRMGAYDYLLKPVGSADLVFAVDRARIRAETDAISREAELERAERREQQLATQRIKDQLSRRQKGKFAHAMFSNIHTSMTQGRGIGSLSTLLWMLPVAEETPDGQNFIISKNLVDMIIDNLGAVTEMVEIFAELEKLVAGELDFKDSTLGEFYAMLTALIAEMRPVADVRGHRILLNELPPRFSGVPLKLNLTFLRKAIRELLLNAMKFSPPGGMVTLLVEYLHTRVLVTVLNTPLHIGTAEITGIPEDYRKMVFEPFFRITRVVHEQYRTLEYGLGLTYVDKVVQMHKGSIVCTSVQDYSADKGTREDLVAFEIELPT